MRMGERELRPQVTWDTIMMSHRYMWPKSFYIQDLHIEMPRRPRLDADADAPRVVQWIDDDDDAPDELKQKIADEVHLYSLS